MAPATRQGTSSRSRLVQRKSQHSRSKLSFSQQKRREDSWEILEDSAQNTADAPMENHDGMDVDESASFAGRNSNRNQYPLHGTKDRLGREVEAFAETLDNFEESLMDIPEVDEVTLYHYTWELVVGYRKIAEDTVGMLQNNHGETERQELASLWKQNDSQHNASFRSTRGSTMPSANQSGSASHSETAVEDLKRWKAELCTWQLIERLIASDLHDLMGEDRNNTAELSEPPSSRFEADGETWNRFISGDKVAAERRIIVKWLEESAEQSGNDLDLIEEELKKTMGTYGFWTQGWMDTRERIKADKRFRPWPSRVNDTLPNISTSDGSKSMITQLDPDAPTRQGRSLQPADARNEQKSWIMCWEMLRRGSKMDDIRSWCAERNEFSKALSIGAHPSAGDKENHANHVNSRGRWRQACRYAARSGGQSEHERAVFGLLGGDLKPLQRVSKSWHDLVYAHYNSLLLRQYEAFVRANYPALARNEDKSGVGLPEGEASKEEAHAIAEKLIVMAQESTDPDPLKALKMIQMRLILRNIPRFTYIQGLVLGSTGFEERSETFKDLIVPVDVEVDEEIPPVMMSEDDDSLRVLTHLYLVWRRLGLVPVATSESTTWYEENPKAGARIMHTENVLAAYIYSLRKSRKLTLIPLYASKMFKARGEQAVAWILPDVQDDNDRLNFLSLILKYDFDISAIFEFHYRNTLEASPLVTKDEHNRGFAYMPFSLVQPKLLVPVREDAWPKMRIAKYGKRDLEPYEAALLRCVQWLTLIEDHFRKTFEILTDLAIRFLLAGNLHAAIELFKRMPCSEMSLSRTQYALGQKVDVMEDHDTGEEQRNSSRRQRKQTDRDMGTPSPDDETLRKTLKGWATTYYELGQLVAAIEALWAWRNVEDSLMGAKNLAASNSDQRMTSKKAIEELSSAMEPLLGDFLLTPSKDIKQPEALQALRDAYLPEMILAYNSALHCAAHLQSRERLLESLDLATKVAENNELVECFRETKRMRDLVDSFAMTSKTMFKLNEAPSKRVPKKGKDKAGRTLAIWEISGSG